jgi:hypothetical protein
MSQFPAFYLSRRNYLCKNFLPPSSSQGAAAAAIATLAVFTAGAVTVLLPALWQKCVRANPKSRTQN